MFLTPWATPGGLRTSREAPTRHLLRRRPRAHVDEDHEHLVAGGNEPDVGLPPVKVEGLDHARIHLAVVDLLDFEAREGRVKARAEASQLGQAPAIVGKPLELDDLHTLDAGLGAVVLNREGALGLIVQPHRTRPPARINPFISLPIIAVLTALGQEGRPCTLIRPGMVVT